MFKSMRSQLTLWYTGILACVLIVFAVAVYFYIARSSARRTDDSLRDSANSYISSLTPELLEQDQPPEEVPGEVLSGFQYRDRQLLVFGESGNSLAVSDAPASFPKSSSPEISVFKTIAGSVSTTGESFLTIGRGTEIRVFALPLKVASYSYSIVVWKPLLDQQQEMFQVRKAFLLAIPAALLLSSVGGYFLARRNLVPIVKLGDQAARISSNNLHQRLTVENDENELGQLTAAFNQLLGRLKVSFDQQRRFMADASHELRTPLAIVRGESEIALSGKDRGIEEFRDALGTIHDEGVRMSRIVEDLFTLARADAGQYPLRPRELYLTDVAAECVRSARFLAEERNIELSFDRPSEDMVFFGDEGLVNRLFMNLIDNGIKYTRPNGKVQVMVGRCGREYLIQFADTGDGIPPEAQQHIFERFYRLNPARTRDLESNGSGAGLGLSIATWIANLHGGRIELTRSNSEGSVFSVYFPIQDDANAT